MGFIPSASLQVLRIVSVFLPPFFLFFYTSVPIFLSAPFPLVLILVPSKVRSIV